MRMISDNNSIDNEKYIFILSAKDKQVLMKQVSNMKEYFLKHHYSTSNLKDICYTLQIGRETMGFRVGFLVTSMNDLLEKLEGYTKGITELEDMFEGESEIDSQNKINQYFQNTKELNEKIHLYFQEKQYKELLKIWAEGISVPWEKMYENKKEYPKIITLPSYPFKQKKYWAPEVFTKKEEYMPKINKGELSRTEKRRDISSEIVDEKFKIICLKEQWKIIPDDNNHKINYQDLIVCFIPNQNREAHNMLSMKFQNVIIVEMGNEYEQIGKKHFIVNDRSGADYIRCIQTIEDQYGTIEGIFYLWTVGSKNDKEHFYYECVMLLLQSLTKTKTKPKDIILAGYYQSEIEHCYAESLIGFSLSTTMILPNTRIRIICMKEELLSVWLEQMTSEYSHPNSNNIWYDNQLRKILSYRKVELIENSPLLLRQNGVYLITGGLGGLGIIFSKWLLEKYHAKLILTGRKSIEEQQDTLVQFMENRNRILYIQADVCNERQMRSVVLQAKNYFGYIDGVIHAAGIEGSGSILENPFEKFKSVIRPKIDGTLNLLNIMKDEKLDFIALFSSSSALLGDFGSCDYSIGNRFLMSVAKYLSSNVYVISWSLWKEGGMAVSDKDSCEMYLKSCGQNYIETITGVQLFENILNNGQKEMSVFNGIETRINEYLPIEQEEKKVKLITKQHLCEDDFNKTQLENYIADDIKEITEKILGLKKDEQKENTNFADFGYDSISLASFSNELKEKYGIFITPDKFYSFPTIEKLSAYLLSNYKKVLELFYQTSVENSECSKDHSKESKCLKETDTSKQKACERIAIVGMSGLFPSANNTKELWEILEKGKNVICKVPDQRTEWYQDNKKHDYRMGVIPQIDEFDPLFFEISPADAINMVPEQRLLLEQIWNALEDAGYGAQLLQTDRIGVFVGAEDSDYRMILPEEGNITADNLALLSARIAYFLDFKGPNMTISTACSSGLMALHQAYSSIKNGECDTAIVAGVSILSTSSAYDKMEKAGMLASDRKCYGFDKRANGMVPAEAVAVVILKRESKAYHDRNRIYASIVASGTNYDGRTNGITAPSGESQKELLKSVYEEYRVDPRKIGYIITHGTSTKLGDPIELNALNEVFSSYTNQTNFCAIGTVKANIGHTLAASGIVSLISMILAMNRQMIPKQIHSEIKNEYINWNNSPFYLPQNNRVWKGTPDNPRLGAISAFGMGGTNVHLVIESSESSDEMSDCYPCELLLISAKTEVALKEKCKDIIKILDNNQDKINLADVSYTLMAGRLHFPYRIAVVASDKKEAIQFLSLAIDNSTQVNVYYNYVDHKFRAQVGMKDVIYKLSEKCASESNATEYKKILGVLAEFYCQGYEIDGELLFAKRVVKRIDLPTYPFAKEKYWKKQKKSLIAQEMDNSSPKHIYLTESWEDTQLENRIKKLQGGLICFVSKAYEEKIKSFMKNYTDERIIFVYQGDSYFKEEKCQYWINRKKITDYELLFQDIMDCNYRIDGIAYLWPIEENASKICGEDLIFIIKAISKTSMEVEKIFVAGTFQNKLEKNYLESLIGFQRSMHMIIPNMIMKIVMLEKVYYDSEEIICSAMREYIDMSNDTICYISGKRKKLELNTLEHIDIEKRRVLEQGCYLITGGLGGIGYIVTKWLLYRYHARVILTGRNMNEEKKKRLAKLKEISPYVTYYVADVCDLAQMRQVVNEAKEVFGKINGVFHLAGVGGQGNILTNDLIEYRNRIAPKIQGTLILNEIFKEDSLDFICYFSSTSAVLGDFGSCEYAVGNRFMTSYVQNNTSNKNDLRKSIVINWPLWENGGMTMGDDRQTQMYLSASGQRLLEPEEAMEYLEECLNSSYSQIMLIVGEYTRIKHMIQHINNTKNIEMIRQEQGYEKTLQRIDIVNQKFISAEDFKHQILRDLCDMVNKLLLIPVEKIDYETIITEYGFDSMTLQKFSVVLNEFYSIDTTPDIFYANPTLLELEEYLEKKYFSKLTDKYNDFKIQKRTEVLKTQNSDIVEKKSAMISKNSMERKSFEQEEKFVNDPNDSIALIGMSGRFPNAYDVNELWNIIINGESVIEEAPLEREEWHRDGKIRKFGCIPGIAEFDPVFFEIPPVEAGNIDPRHRLLLQEVWKALENAGYGSKLLKNDTVGVFVGAEDNNYQNIVGNDAKLVSNHSAVLAARLSYLLNLSGPNICINTACSSGLSAVHEAILSIKSGECDTAIVAGVNLLIEPSGYDKMMESGMLSNTMTCYPFDRRANGMVPGEAVAVIVLKRLSKAVKDKNPILATVLGSGMNYDGKTNGITAPSGKAQVSLINSVYKKYKIEPRKIGYIIAHGTGTRLGDPIEMNALTEIFRTFTDYKEFCAIGSPKANLGHSLAASGIVSLIILVMAMQKEIIPKQINCEEKSDYIHWKESPFYIATENRRWRNTDKSAKIGAVSSFGMSGTNVHVVIESYQEPKREKERPENMLVVLSAKKEQSLKQKRIDLANMLEKSGKDLRLSDISYTSIEGRKHFAYRCAIIASDLQDLIFKLRSSNTDGVLMSRVKKNFIPDNKETEELNSLIIRYHEKETEREWLLIEIAKKYIYGLTIDGDFLFCNMDVKRCILPNYPFERNKYWIGPSKRKKVKEVLHPLVETNNSSLKRQEYSTVFSGKERILCDHVIQKKKVLSGVAYLEMVRYAAEDAMERLNDNSVATQISNISWYQPLVVTNMPVEVFIKIHESKEQPLTYEVSSNSIKSGIVHSQGCIDFKKNISTETRNIEKLLINKTKVVSGKECYQLYTSLGMEYGTGFQCIQEINICEEQIISRLKLSSDLEDDINEYVLYPGMIDGCLQTTIGFAFDEKDLTRLTPEVPFAIDQITIYESCKTEMWAIVTRNNLNVRLSKYDIELCDNTGKICVEIKGYASRSIHNKRKQEIGKAILLQRKKTISNLMPSDYRVVQVTSIYIGIKDAPSNAINIHIPAQIVPEEVASIFEKVSRNVFLKVKSLLKIHSKHDQMLQIFVPNDVSGQLYGSISGILKTAHIENPSFWGKVIQVDKNLACNELLEISEFEKKMYNQDFVVYQNNQRYIEILEEILSNEKTEIEEYPWKNESVYLITGGGGGIGRIIALEIAKRTKNSVIIIAGRSQENSSIKEFLSTLKQLGTEAIYRSVDVTNLSQVERLVKDIVKKYHVISGVIHMAGVIHDQFIIRKSIEEFLEVLRVKVMGAVNLDLATRDIKMDFMIYFSSITGELGNLGQADYAAANRFMDNYSYYRNGRVSKHECYGRTISINWPFWKEGKMQIIPENVKQMNKETGFLPLPYEEGIKVMGKSWMEKLDEIICIYGEAERINLAVDMLCKKE